MENGQKGPSDSDFKNSPLVMTLTELSLNPISNYRRVTIKKNKSSLIRLLLIISPVGPFSLFHMCSPISPAQPTGVAQHSLQLTCATLSKVRKSRGPICVFPS